MPEVGKLQQTTKELQIEWKIANFFRLAEFETELRSPSFSFMNISLRMYLKRAGRYDRNLYYRVILEASDCESNTINVTSGIKNVHGTVEKMCSYHLNTKGMLLINFFVLSQLYERKCKLVPSGDLTVVCILNQEYSCCPELTAPPTKLIELETLSEDLRKLFDMEKSWDTTLEMQVEAFTVHRSILIARSSVFAAVFEQDLSEEETGVIPVADCDPNSFSVFLQYLYSGKVEGMSAENAVPLYRTADKYDVQKLKSFCVKFMAHNLTPEIVCDVVSLADQHDENELLSVAQFFFNRNMSKIFATDEWRKLLRENYRLANKLLSEMASMFERKSGLVLSDILNQSNSCSTELTTPPTELIELEILSDNLRVLLDNKKSCDTTLKVQDKEFRVHKSILVSRSLVFAAMFEHDLSEKKTGVISIADCDPDSFSAFLEYLYTGKVENMSADSAIHLYRTADKYDVQKLKLFCVKIMEHNLTPENVCDVVSLADQYKEAELVSTARVFFNRNMKKIFPTVEWQKLLSENFPLANKLLTEMASKVKIRE